MRRYVVEYNEVSPAQKRVMEAIRKNGYGHFDRFYRLVVSNEVIARGDAGKRTMLLMFKHELVYMNGEHIHLTQKGVKALKTGEF